MMKNPSTSSFAPWNSLKINPKFGQNGSITNYRKKNIQKLHNIIHNNLLVFMKSARNNKIKNFW